MRRTILTLAAGLTAASFATPGISWGAEGCSPIPCTVSGLLSGSNIVPDPTFEWTLSLDGPERWNGYLYRKPPARLVGQAHRVALTPSTYIPLIWREVPPVYGYQVSGYLDVGYGHHTIYVSGTLVDRSGLVSGTLQGWSGRASIATVTIAAGRLTGVVSSSRLNAPLPPYEAPTWIQPQDGSPELPESPVLLSRDQRLPVPLPL